MPSLLAVILTSRLPPATDHCLPRTLSPPPCSSGCLRVPGGQPAGGLCQKLIPSASGSQQAEQLALAREHERISRQLAPAAEREDEMGKALTAAQVCV